MLSIKHTLGPNPPSSSQFWSFLPESAAAAACRPYPGDPVLLNIRKAARRFFWVPELEDFEALGAVQVSEAVVEILGGKWPLSLSSRRAHLHSNKILILASTQIQDKCSILMDQNYIKYVSPLIIPYIFLRLFHRLAMYYSIYCFMCHSIL